MKVEGTVVNVFSKTKNTRAGDKTIWYAEIDSGDTLNIGFKPTMEEGEYISVNAEEKYGELQVSRGGSKGGSLPATKDAGSTAGKANTGGSYRRAGGGKFPVEPTDSQVSIIRQSSLNRAVETVRDMVACGLCEFATIEDYENEILRLAYDYTDFGTGQREVKAAKHKEVQRAALEAVNG